MSLHLALSAPARVPSAELWAASFDDAVVAADNGTVEAADDFGDFSGGGALCEESLCSSGTHGSCAISFTDFESAPAAGTAEPPAATDEEDVPDGRPQGCGASGSEDAESEFGDFSGFSSAVLSTREEALAQAELEREGEEEGSEFGDFSGAEVACEAVPTQARNNSQSNHEEEEAPQMRDTSQAP